MPKSHASRISQKVIDQLLHNGYKGLRHCERCQGSLPCQNCATEVHKELGLVGQEPDEEELVLAPEVAAIAREVREEGFVGRSGRDKKLSCFYPPWSPEVYRLRSGADDSFEFPVVHMDEV